MKHITNDEKWYDFIPISVNDTYGDPFIIEQLDNTLLKLESLYTHKGPIAIFTKAPYNLSVIEKIEQLSNKLNDNIIIFYSLTGLNEGNFSFENRVTMINCLRQIFENVVIMPRPIIKNQNDSKENLNKIVDVALNLGLKRLVLGGIHNNSKKKLLNDKVETYLFEKCLDSGVKPYYKTSCCAASIMGFSCWLHTSYNPCNLDIIKKMGYDFELNRDIIILSSASTGDLNFVKIITGGQVIPTGKWFAKNLYIPTI